MEVYFIDWGFSRGNADGPIQVYEKSQITDAGMVHLAKLGQLESLSLRGTRVGDAGIEHLVGLVNLRELLLTYTPVTDCGVMHLRRLVKLETLDLESTPITEVSLDFLAELPNLRHLVVPEAVAKSPAAARLQIALPNCEIKAGWPHLDSVALDDLESVAHPVED